MHRMFMLRLMIGPEADRAYIDFGPMDECPGGNIAHRQAIVNLEDEIEIPPVVSVGYEYNQRITAIEILNPSRFLGNRFRTDGDQAVFPVYLNLDHKADMARITLRDREVKVAFDESSLRAVVNIRELPGDTVSSVQSGYVGVHYNTKGKISAISIRRASIMLPKRFLLSRSEGK